MSDTQVYVLDVFNNTDRQVVFMMTNNTSIVGAVPTPYPIPAGKWLSTQNNNTPLYLTLNDNYTGSLSFTVQDVSDGTTGSFVLEFDGTQLTNFPGMAFYGSAGDIADPVGISGGGYIFPLLYMNMLYQGNPLTVLMLVEGTSSNVGTPPYAS